MCDDVLQTKTISLTSSAFIPLKINLNFSWDFGIVYECWSEKTPQMRNRAIPRHPDIYLLLKSFAIKTTLKISSTFYFWFECFLRAFDEK